MVISSLIHDVVTDWAIKMQTAPNIIHRILLIGKKSLNLHIIYNVTKSDNIAMRYAIVAGESSGDLHGSRLIESLKRLDPGAEFAVIGGDRMSSASGVSPEIHCSEMNVMGFAAVVRSLPRILGQLGVARRMIAEFHPDRLILVDYPSFNLRLAKYAHKLGIRVDYYISPKLWAWKEWRVKTMRRCVSRCCCILPFEPDFYRRHGYDGARYVGNPSVDEITSFLGHISPLKHFMERNGIKDERPMIALLPGSRYSEIAANLPVMISAAKRYPEFQYIVAAAPDIPEKFYRETAQDPGLTVVFDDTLTLVKYSRAAIVVSGTATLETALLGTPQVVCYRANGSKWTYGLMSRVLKVRYVSLPNLITGSRVVPELLLHRCTVEGVARELLPLLQSSPQRDWQLRGYKMMRAKLGTESAPEIAAEIIMK